LLLLLLLRMKGSLSVNPTVQAAARRSAEQRQQKQAAAASSKLAAS